MKNINNKAAIPNVFVSTPYPDHASHLNSVMCIVADLISSLISAMCIVTLVAYKELNTEAVDTVWQLREYKSNILLSL